MSEENELAGKKAYIEYRKLQRFRQDVRGLKAEVCAVNGAVKRYNEMLTICREVLSKDPQFSNSIKGLAPLTPGGSELGDTISKVKQLNTESGLLLSSLEAFISWYLPEEKQRTIGFRQEE